MIDPHTVRIVYKRLYSPAVGTWAIGLLPEHLLDAEALRREAVLAGADPAEFGLRQSAFNRRPVGCGPFVFREWKSDQYIELERFARYWEGPPNYRRYVYRIVPDLLTQEMEFYAGTIDTYAVQPHQVARLEADPRFQSFSGTSYSYSYIGYNLRRKPFDDPRVRRALGHGDRRGQDHPLRSVRPGRAHDRPLPAADRVLRPLDRPAPLRPGRRARACSPRPAGSATARAGSKRTASGCSFTLITNSGNDIRKSILAIAQDAWRQIGVDVRTDLLEWSVFIKERVNKLDFDALVLGWSMGIDPDLYQIWHSSQTGPHQLNFVGYRNPEADDLIVRIRQEYDFRRQVELCHRLHAIIARDQPYTFLYVGKWTAVLDRRIVIREPDGAYRRITPTRTGSYMFYFNHWIKLAEVPQFAKE